MKVMYMYNINDHIIIGSNVPACNAALEYDINSVHPNTKHQITRIPCIFETTLKFSYPPFWLFTMFYIHLRIRLATR